jgi:hypothetical protein
MAKEKPAEKPLYEDKQIKIEIHPTSIDDHILYIKEEGAETPYLLPRGVLEELARRTGAEVKQKIDTLNSMLLYHMEKEGISITSLHAAICQAHKEEERRYSEAKR